MSDQRQEQLIALLEGGIAGAIGAAGGLTGDVPTAMATASTAPFIARLLRYGVVGVMRTWEVDRVDEMLSAAESAHEGTLDDLLERAMISDSRLLLLSGAIEAASQSSLAGKAQLLGRALVEGLIAEDDADVDVRRLVVSVLRDIEAPHVAVLHILEMAHEGVSCTGITAKRPEFSPVIDNLVATLERHGLTGRELVGIDGGGSDLAVSAGGASWTVVLRPLGGTLLDELRKTTVEGT